MSWDVLLTNDMAVCLSIACALWRKITKPRVKWNIGGTVACFCLTHWVQWRLLVAVLCTMYCAWAGTNSANCNGGSRISQVGRQPIFLAKIAENCMKMNQIWNERGVRPKILLCRSATELDFKKILIKFCLWNFDWLKLHWCHCLIFNIDCFRLKLKQSYE